MKLHKNLKQTQKTGRHPKLRPTYQKQPTYTYRSSANQQLKVSPSERSPKLKMRRLVPIFIVGAILLVAVNSLFLNNGVHVKVVGETKIKRDPKTYQAIVNKSLSSGLVNRFKPNVDSHEIIEHLQADLPEVDQISLHLPLLIGRPTVALHMGEPVLKFITSNGTYLLNDNGQTLFEQKDKSSAYNDASLPSIVDQSNTPVVLSKPALSAAQVDYVQEILYQFKVRQLSAERISLRPGGGELRIKLKNTNYMIKFNFYEDPRQSVGSFLAAKKRIERSGPVPTQYIDVRIPERAYIR